MNAIFHPGLVCGTHCLPSLAGIEADKYRMVYLEDMHTNPTRRMRDTPRTDSRTARADSHSWICCDVVVSADFARELEREIETLKESFRVECNRLRGEVKSWRECAEQLAADMRQRTPQMVGVSPALSRFDELQKTLPR